MKRILLALLCFVLVGCSYSYEAEVIRIEEPDDPSWWTCDNQRITYLAVTKGGDAFMLRETYIGDILIRCGYHGEVGKIATFTKVF